MSRWKHIGCPKCGSSDALSYKEGDEWGKCFSCGKSTKLDGSNEMTSKAVESVKKLSLMEIGSYDTRGFKERGITKTVAEHYGVRVAYAEDGTIESHFYPYTIKGEVVAYKERKLPKTFLIHGNFKGVELFGQSVSSGGKRIVITEGELDCMAVAQAQYEKYSKFYPVVALPSASQTSVALEQREWLRTFDEVILMLDQDEPGRKASEQLAKIIGFDKVKVAKLPEKDPCEVLIKHGSQALMSCVFDAQAYNPSGVVRGEEIWERYKVKESVVSIPYPPCLNSLNEKIKGIRMGEITLFTSGTGSGKSTVIKEIVLELLQNPDAMVGMVSLEESIGDTAEKFIGMQLRKNLTEDDTVTEEDKREAFEQIFGDNRLVLLDHQGSVSDESLIDKMEYLALIGCKYIILDHITIAVSEGVKGKTGNEAIDAFMSDLLKITKKHDIWLGVISHLRKGDKPFEEGHLPTIDDIKGSGSIKQISFDIVAFARNMVAATPEEQNTIKLRVLKSRFTGKTGDCGNTRYNPKTTRLESVNMLDFGL
jgi:twinkle protein